MFPLVIRCRKEGLGVVCPQVAVIHHEGDVVFFGQFLCYEEVSEWWGSSEDEANIGVFLEYLFAELGSGAFSAFAAIGDEEGLEGQAADFLQPFAGIFHDAVFSIWGAIDRDIFAVELV